MAGRVATLLDVMQGFLNGGTYIMIFRADSCSEFVFIYILLIFEVQFM